MKDKNLGIPINQDEVYHYLKDIRKIKVMTPDRERELAVKMKSNEISDKERKQIEEELLIGNLRFVITVAKQYQNQGLDLQDLIAESILQTLVEIGPKVVENPTDYALASNFMWSCTMALNGLIQKGVPSDWATHMIGHELTALYNIDHARTLAIIGPNLYRVLFETKKEKLAQYGKRVFQLTGTDEEIAREAIGATVAFYHTMGMKTKISENASNIENTADFIVNRFEERGWKALGERQNISLDKLREIVELSY